MKYLQYILKKSENKYENTTKKIKQLTTTSPVNKHWKLIIFFQANGVVQTIFTRGPKYLSGLYL